MNMCYETNERTTRMSLIADKMEMEALYLEQQIALLEKTIEEFKNLELQGAPSVAREGLENILRDMKSDLKSLDESLKSIVNFI